MNEEIIARFLENADSAAATTSRLKSSRSLGKTLKELLPAEAVVYCPGISKLEQSAAKALANRVEDYAAAEICVEEVLAGIAETGSLVCGSGEGRAVQASLLPDRHVALLPAEKIFATLDDFFTAVTENPPTNLTLITGPSRTADIELTLAIGVHGPGQVDILVI